MYELKERDENGVCRSVPAAMSRAAEAADAASSRRDASVCEATDDSWRAMWGGRVGRDRSWERSGGGRGRRRRDG